jgi:hypothetical protein
VKRASLQAFDARTGELRANALLHFFGGVLGVGERENLIGPRMTLAHKVGDALNQNGSLAGAGARKDDHGAMNVIDRLTLALIGNDFFRGSYDGRTH